MNILYQRRWIKGEGYLEIVRIYSDDPKDLERIVDFLYEWALWIVAQEREEKGEEK